MRHIKIAASVCLVLCLLAGTAGAFNGDRKGFLLGGGIGISPVVDWDYKNESQNNDLGPAFQLHVGLGLCSRNVLMATIRVIPTGKDAADIETIHAQNAITWNHYFNAEQDGIYVSFGTAGFLLSRFENGTDEKSTLSLEQGIEVGAGYAFNTNFQAGVHLSYCDSEYYNAPIVTISVSYIAFQL